MADETEEITDYYGVESTSDGFLVIDGRNERPVALRHTRLKAEAIARQLNGEPAQEHDEEALAEPLYNKEFGPNTEEPTCFWN